MLRILCTFLALLLALVVICSNNVESRTVHGKSDGVKSLSQHHGLLIGQGEGMGETSSEDDHGGYLLSKRKSELLSSLYGLPYALVNRRDED